MREDAGTPFHRGHSSPAPPELSGLNLFGWTKILFTKNIFAPSDTSSDLAVNAFTDFSVHEAKDILLLFPKVLNQSLHSSLSEGTLAWWCCPGLTAMFRTSSSESLLSVCMAPVLAEVFLERSCSARIKASYS